MKKLVYSLFMLTAVAMLLASCSTQFSTVSITKRHYNNGYYVDFNSKHKSETVALATKTTSIETTPIASVTAAKNMSKTVTVEEPIATSIAPAPKNKEDIAPLTASAVKHSAPENLNHSITPNSLKELKNIQAVSKAISENRGHNNSNDSLIWTIIIILLLLWLLSYLTGGWGLGGLIWLFLVIAIIILLLKLLGVI